MEVKPGYKQTEVGVIPEDWVVTTIGEQSRIFGRIGFRGYTVQDIVEEGKGAIAINPSNIQNGESVFEKCTYVSWEKFEESPEIKIDEGDIILVKTGSTVGKTAMVKRLPEKATLNPQVVVFKRLTASPGFFGYMMGSPVVQKQITESVVGGAVPTLSQKLVAAFKLPLPQLSEQRAIATALSDMDALLDGLIRLIAKKRNLKQATMQQLLTGQTRLPGFSEEWDQVRLGDLFSFKNGLNKAKEFFGYGKPIVNYMDVFRCSAIRSSNLEGRVSLSRHELKNFDVQKGDVFFTRTSETPEEIGLASVVLDQPTDTVFSGFLLRARPRNEHLNDEFKAYCFDSVWVRQQITSKASYTTRALTNGRILSEVLLPLPPLPEQSAIATVLSDMDAELASLEARLAKTRAVKQAMMQELLTGKTRLLTPEVAHA